MAKAYEQLGDTKRATRMRGCGAYMTFFVNKYTNEKHLRSINACQLRTCPVCSYRLASKNYHQTLDILQDAEMKQFSRLVFVTLTIPNCEGKDLKKTIGKMLSAFHKMTSKADSRWYKAFVEDNGGWLRSLEVTYNEKTRLFHPHVHVLCAVRPEYFSKNNKNYIKTEELVQLWKQAYYGAKGMKDKQDLVCYMEAVSNKHTCKDGDSNSHVDAVREVAKYACKPLKDEILEQNPEVLQIITEALYRCRTKAYGGKMKEVFNRLRFSDPNEDETTSTTRSFCIKLEKNPDWDIEAWYWNKEGRKYIATRLKDKNNKRELFKITEGLYKKQDTEQARNLEDLEAERGFLF